jgi:hypothetical protein
MMKISSLLLSVGVLVTGWSGFAYMAGAAPGTAPARGTWSVFVVDQLSARTKDAPAKWATIWSDGNNSRRFEAPLFSLDGKPYTLKVTNTTKREACSQGKYPFTMSVDQLVAEPLAGGAAKTLFGQIALQSAKDLMKEHLSSCEGMKPLPYSPDSTESYERARIRLVSIYGDNLGLETVTESFAYGRPKALVSNDWATYQFKDDDLVKVGKKVLPDGALTEATSAFVKLTPADRDGYSPADLSHYAFVPAGGGVAVEFGVPATQEAAMGSVRTVRVVKPGGLKEDYSKTRQAFVAAHPKLIAWDKATVYTVAPDQSSVVYAQDGKLYWQPVAGKPKLLGQVKDVRGWQWQNARQLSAAEKKALGMP